MEHDQAGCQRDGHHGAVKGDLHLGEVDVGHVGDGLHHALAGQRHDVRRHVEEDAEGHQNGAQNDHAHPDDQALRRGKEGRAPVAEGGEVAEDDAHHDLEQVPDLKGFAQDQNLDQHQGCVNRMVALPISRPHTQVMV